MYRNILLAHDGSAASAKALRQATCLARQYGAALQILGIVPTGGGYAIAQATAGVDVWGMKRRMIEQALAEAGSGEDCMGVPHVIVVREGDPAAEIVAHAREMHADLVVMGHSNRRSFTRWFIDSTAETLLQHLPCSLLIAP